MPSSFDEKVKRKINRLVEETLEEGLRKEVGSSSALASPSLLEKHALLKAVGVLDNRGADGYHLMGDNLTEEGRICREFLY